MAEALEPSRPEANPERVAALAEAQKLRTLAGSNPPVLPENAQTMSLSPDLSKDRGLTYLIKRLYLRQNYTPDNALKASLAVSADLIEKLGVVPTLSPKDQVGITRSPDGTVALYFQCETPYPQFVNLVLKAGAVDTSASAPIAAPAELRRPIVEATRSAEHRLSAEFEATLNPFDRLAARLPGLVAHDPHESVAGMSFCRLSYKDQHYLFQTSNRTGSLRYQIHHLPAIDSSFDKAQTLVNWTPDFEKIINQLKS